MKRGLSLLVFVLGCRPGYAASDLELVTAYRAKELCSCLFVMNHSESYCRRYTAEEPDVASYRIDEAQRSVTTSAFFLWGASARWESPQTGCVLD